MKALSIRQPWAWLICKGIKDIENRDWHTEFRGRIYVHAPKFWDAVFPEEIFDIMVDAGQEEQIIGLRDWWAKEAIRTDGITSQIIGEVDIVDCIPKSQSLWFAGRYGFALANPTLYEKPILCRGRLGFFEPATTP